MKKPIAFTAIAAALLTHTAAANAENTSGQFAVEGPGQLTCNAFTRARADKGSAEFQRLIGYVEGYLSAANRYEPNTFDLSPWHNAAAFDLILEKHCADNPQDTMVGVVQKMVSALRPIRITEYSPMVEVGAGENRAFVYRAILRRTQAALKSRGFYAGAEDGSYSPQMRDALMAFQKKADLFATGVPDPATLWTLLNP